MKHYIFALIASFLLLLQAAAQQPASVPKLINYQGKLTNAEGHALQNGNYNVRFTLWDSASGGNLVWGENRTITLVSGVFNVALGGAGSTPVAGAAVNDLTYAFGSENRFLETTILSGPGVTQEQTLAPRQQMTSVPYAMSAPGVVPIGGIIMWWGDLSNIPVNFELCDGGTPAAGSVMTGAKPDLRGRFARGAPTGTTNVTNPVVSGGVDSLDLAHTHGAGTLTAMLVGPSVAGGQSIQYQQKATQGWQSSNYMYVADTPRLVDGAQINGPYTVGTAVNGQTSSSLGVVDNRPAFSQVFYLIRVK